MKKSNIALAALALVASSAAFAEVKVSGIIDVGVANGTGRGTYMEQGGWADHSSITFAGNEDMGAGLKAFFVLEAGFTQNGDAGNGGNGGLFSRQTAVGLSSDQLGSLSLGQQLSPFILSNAISNQGVGNFWVNRLIMGGGLGAAAVNTNPDAYTDPTDPKTNLGNQKGGFFIANSILYTTPTIAGWSASAMMATKNGARDGAMADAVNSDKYNSFAINGSIAGVAVTAATQSRKETYSSWMIGASYPVNEELSVSANYISHKNKIDDLTTKSWALGASYKVAPAVTLVAQYARNNLDNAQSMYNIGAAYALSKRTNAYITYVRATNGAIAALADRGLYATEGSSNNNTVVGITHSF